MDGLLRCARNDDLETEPLPSRFVISRPHTTRAMLSLARDRRAFKKRTARGHPMEIGYFTMPSHPPECGLKEGHDWDLQVLRWLDELGYQEAWVASIIPRHG